MSIQKDVSRHRSLGPFTIWQASHACNDLSLHYIISFKQPAAVNLLVQCPQSAEGQTCSNVRYSSPLAACKGAFTGGADLRMCLRSRQRSPRSAACSTKQQGIEKVGREFLRINDASEFHFSCLSRYTRIVIGL